MSELIERTQKLIEGMSGVQTRISSDIKEILKAVAINPAGVPLEISWDAEDNNGDYQKSIVVTAVKVTKEKVYFINPIKVVSQPCIIEEKHKKGPARRIEKDGLESMELSYLLQLSKKSPIYGII